MNVEEVIKKAESDEGLTVKEIKVYQKAVKPVKHVYGKYGTLAKRYLEDKGLIGRLQIFPNTCTA